MGCENEETAKYPKGEDLIYGGGGEEEIRDLAQLKFIKKIKTLKNLLINFVYKY